MKRDIPGSFENMEFDHQVTSKRAIIFHIVGCLLMIVALPVIWHLIFVRYPATKMTDIEGIVTETHFLTDRSPFNMKNTTYTYYLKLDKYNTPLKLDCNRIDDFPASVNGLKVTLQVLKKDLKKIKEANLNIPLNEINTIRYFPRVYGIATETQVIITPADVLRQIPSPQFPGSISYIVVIFTVIYMIFTMIKLSIKLFGKNHTLSDW
ncbi:MAG: hypothetical protein LBV74_17680 [Tannerella sp.]|jgi:hypothetical protein|nr:hypothetical protein [Tannerella sp.]